MLVDKFADCFSSPSNNGARGSPEFESLERLAELRAADTGALADLADLLEVLRTQLTQVRFTGSTADDAQAVVTELWARLEGLAGALDPGPT